MLFQTELGARFEELPKGFSSLSVVTSVTPGSESHRLGLSIGCVVVGINGEKHISHAHTITCLKHSKRPITVRFKKP